MVLVAEDTPLLGVAVVTEAVVSLVAAEVVVAHTVTPDGARGRVLLLTVPLERQSPPMRRWSHVQRSPRTQLIPIPPSRDTITDRYSSTITIVSRAKARFRRSPVAWTLSTVETMVSAHPAPSLAAGMPRRHLWT